MASPDPAATPHAPAQPPQWQPTSASRPAGAQPSLQELVARSADAADRHAAVPALLLDLQTALGALTSAVTASTERGRRPFRPGPDWEPRLGELAYLVFLLGDQTGSDVAALLAATADAIELQAPEPAADADAAWPLSE